MKRLLMAAALLGLVSCSTEKINRVALLERNNPHITAIDTLASLTVGLFLSMEQVFMLQLNMNGYI